MASVEKMLIKGIRSFSPDNQNVIDFYKPLTVIVGQNGAGKTTIIECLRMSCSGSLPPNTRSGQSFIHDPKVANDTEVKGQIRLRIRGNNGHPVVIVRSFQLTQKKTNMQFKALDQVVQTFNKETGEKQALTYKCADIDKIVPTIMGVSKAILENVIFVHQEDSNWPLADPKTLKERFDDVFAATKYTKALEAIRKLRVEKVQEVKELRLKVDHLKTHKDNAKKLNAEIGDSKTKSEQLKSQMEEVEREIEEIQSRSEPLESKLSELADVGNRIVEMKTQQKTMAKHNAEMFAKLKDGDYQEETVELESWVKQFDDRMDAKKVDLAKIKRDIQHASMNVAALKEQYARSCQRQGKLQAESDAHNNNIIDRDRFLESTAEETGISCLTGEAPYAEEVVSRFCKSVAEKVQSLEAQLRTMKSENRGKDNNMSQAIDSLTAQLSGITETVRLKNEQIANNEARRKSLETQMNQIVASESVLDGLRQREGRALSSLEGNKKEQERRNLTQEIQVENNNIEELQKRVHNLRQERDKLSAASETDTRRRVKKQELAVKEEELKNLMDTNRGRIRGLLNRDVEAAEVRQKVDALLTRNKEEFQKKNDELSLAQNRLSQSKGVLNAARQLLESYEAQLSDARDKMKNGLCRALGQQLSEDQYLTSLTEQENSSTKMVERVSRMKASVKMMSTYVKIAEKESFCPLCKRGFNEDEKENFVMNANVEIEELPAQVGVMESRLSEIQRKMGGLKELQPLWVRFSDLRDKQITSQRQKVNVAESDWRSLENQTEDLVSLCALAQHELDASQSVLEEVAWPVESLHNEVQRIRSEVDHLDQQAMSSIPTRSVSEVDNELDDLERERARHEKVKDSILRQQNRLRDEFVNLSNQYRDCKEEVERYMNDARRRDELKERVRELDRQNAQLEHQTESLEVELTELQPQRDQLVRQREEKRKQAGERETVAENKVRVMRGTSDRLQSKMQVLQEYQNSGKTQELENVSKLMLDQDSRMENLNKRMEQLEEDRKKFDDEIRNQEELRRTIQDCLDWRRGREEEKKVESKIDQFERRMREIGDHTAMMRDLESMGEEKNKLKSKFDMMRGALGTVQHTLSRAEKDLSAPQYRGIEAKYRKLDVEVKTMEMANADLDKYHKALERALLTFHTTKMADINKIIKELWQKTYRGHDIDYIQIRADTQGTGKSSYNYRLVMIVGGAELEMRGRCSAGQKVLACIIVRLALAETFCLNCGILTLDEPTTNLDQANAKSLAEGLRLIIHSRKQQENFQLVVITHDESFAQMLGTREHAEKMWRVTKDENHHSLITQEDIE